MPAAQELSAAYVLHTRAYRETSLLVDLFTLEQGRVSAVARGARRRGASGRYQLQAFQPIQASWTGRQALKQLTHAEPAGVQPQLQGRSLLCGLYANELLQRLLPEFESCPQLYLYYTYLLNELHLANDLEGALRTFERKLLDTLGYAFPWPPLQDQQIHYQYTPETGFTPCMASQYSYPGIHLQAIAEDCYELPETKRLAKRLMRTALAEVLGPKPLKSRELFLSTRRL
ncbi:DNA repair protein RecO [Nitrincola tapanii]|uniref:DNA repair protein RecO n=1 Tax=Nitrincola tapanii TaxID=1708751 RepID=A0A5A9VZ65_9GAMM|nr:DNA repair protein RecO [Nitrincola tapanii]KAA0873827.1 DNA repair protein RecO [Nitrincola tapanii]